MRAPVHACMRDMKKKKKLNNKGILKKEVNHINALCQNRHLQRAIYLQLQFFFYNDPPPPPAKIFY